MRPIELNYTYLRNIESGRKYKPPKNIDLSQTLIQLPRAPLVGYSAYGQLSSPMNHQEPLESRSFEFQNLHTSLLSPVASGITEPHLTHKRLYDYGQFNLLKPTSQNIHPQNIHMPILDSIAPFYMARINPTLQYYHKIGITNRYIPIIPPSYESDTIRSPTRSSYSRNAGMRGCISWNLTQSPCWRPSWLIRDGQLCISCGLLYKKTHRWINMQCKKIPAKVEWAVIQTNGLCIFSNNSEGYACLDCGSKVMVGENNK